MNSQNIFSLTCGFEECLNPSSDSFLQCSGTCETVFHPKCVGLTQPLADKILNPDTGLLWCCKPCRQFSISTISFKISKLEKEFLGFENKLKVILMEFPNFRKSFDDLKNSNSNKSLITPDDDISPHKLRGSRISEDNILAVETPSDAHVSVASLGSHPITTNVNDEFVTKRKQKSFNKSKKALTSVQRKSMRHEIHDSLRNTDEIRSVSNIIELNNNTINDSASQCSLVTIPPPRDIFVSRFGPSTESSGILDYIRLAKGLSLDGIECEKISKPISMVASFKIKVPLDLFNTICSYSFWPEYTFVKEFKRKRRPFANHISKKNKNEIKNKNSLNSKAQKNLSV